MSEGMKSGMRWLRWVVEVFLVLTALAAVLAAAVGEAPTPRRAVYRCAGSPWCLSPWP